MLTNDKACQNSDPPTNKKCYSLHQQLPELRNITSIILSEKEKVVLICNITTPPLPPLLPRRWNVSPVRGPTQAVSLVGALFVCQEPSLASLDTALRRETRWRWDQLCPPPRPPRHHHLQAEDVDDYDDWPDDVSSNAAWGYCDKKCHVSMESLKAQTLQEVLRWCQPGDISCLVQVELHIFTDKQSLKKTKMFAGDDSKLYLRPMVRNCNPHWLIIFLINKKKKVKKELGVAKKSLRETQIVKLEDGKFEKKRKKTSFVFGGSDTCQVVTPVIFTDFIHSHRLKIKFWNSEREIQEDLFTFLMKRNGEQFLV